ncbi:putative lipid II flippase FtsW [Lottiidibacillus patelloidae]|uniref:Probable peptidoglycan glycosyltransferase FtsW n=2 Tax=Lottiidibacillus patelloidae TaxID=2670334 RepID=A0A263BVZ9_9BACI|nr:putative lipid II flippase FtsW [Lottiidibacillus patelloidae]
MLIVLVWLLLFGLVMVYSASLVVAVMIYDYQIDFFYAKQLRSIIVASLVFIVACFIPYSFYRKLNKLAILSSIVILIYVLVKGTTANNASQWISVFGMTVQPSELVKLSVIIYLATIFSKKQKYIGNFSRGVAPPVIIVAVILGLIIVQPDFGTSMVIAFTSFILILCSGMKLRHLAILSLIGMVLLGIFFNFVATNEQKSRINGAYQPFEDPSDDGYQLINSYLAFATGGVTGQGFGESIQKFGYLPEPHTDFIIAVIGEEFGLIGVFMVLSLLFFIVIRGLLIGIRCQDTFGSLLAIGISSLIGTQTFINIGVAIGLLPITGVTLPFISYGGSSLLSLMLAMGILMNLSAHNKMEMKQKKKHDNVVPLHKHISHSQ